MSENNAAHLARISETLLSMHAALDRIERSQSDPEEMRQALSDIASGYALITQLAEVATVQRTAILEIVEWMRERISGAEQREQVEEAEYMALVVRQISSTLQGTRDDIVLMRKDLRELRAAIELAVGQQPADPMGRQQDGSRHERDA